MKLVQRHAVVDGLGRFVAILGKGYRNAPTEQFEYGTRDADGILHVEGIARVEKVALDEREPWFEVGAEWFESHT